MRSALVAALAVAAGLVLVAMFGASGFRAHAQEPGASLFYGYVAPDESGALPLRVRATISGITCGTGDVFPLEGIASGAGVYIVPVASASEKAGCGEEGVQVSFVLFSGEVDEGSPAAQTQAWAPGTHQLDLSPLRDSTFGTFLGELPAGPGLGVMRWTGGSAAPIDEAVATIARDVESVAYWDVLSQSYRIYIPGAPSVVSDYLWVDRDDIVFVRVR